jgi:hypothetical protein
MADELGDLCKKISLTKGEKDGIQVKELDVSEARVIAGKCLIGKVWTDKNVNQEAFKTVFSNIWRIVGSVKFKELKDNMWLVEFSDDGDKRRVLEARPWSFDRQILVLNEFDGITPPSQLDFSHSPFWVQVHDMPLLCMNKNVGTKIGNSLGELQKVDVVGNRLGWVSYLRLRVSLDITKPLDHGRALKFAGKSSWMSLNMKNCRCSVSGVGALFMVPEAVQFHQLCIFTIVTRQSSGVRGSGPLTQNVEGQKQDRASGGYEFRPVQRQREG